MDSFEILQPSAELSLYIKNYWYLRANGMNQVQGVIPTGNINLFFHRGTPLQLEHNGVLLPQAFVSGQSTTYSNLIQSSITDMLCVTFQPFGARMFFNMPMSEFKEQSVALDLLGDPELEELGQRIQETFDISTCIQIIERFLKKRFFYPSEYNLKRMATAINAISSGNSSIEDLASISCLSQKQFKRIFNDYVGLNPKEFIRMIRFQRALYILQNNPTISLTQLAYACDFYDQSHLISEFKRISGYTPSQYIAICDPYSDYFS